MNIACPRCGGTNYYLTLPWPPQESPGSGASQDRGHQSEYVCLTPTAVQPPGDGNAKATVLRCGAIFRVDVPATLVDRPLRDYELDIALKGFQFAPRPQLEVVDDGTVDDAEIEHAAAEQALLDGKVTPSQILATSDRFDDITYGDTADGPGTPQYREAIAMGALSDFLNGRSLGVRELFGRAGYRWAWVWKLGDSIIEELTADEVLQLSRLSVAAMRVGS